MTFRQPVCTKTQKAVYNWAWTCTCNHNGVTGSTCQQLHPAQPSHCELSHMGLLGANVPWPTMSSLVKLPTIPGKQTHIQLTLYLLGTQTEKRCVLVTFFNFN